MTDGARIYKVSYHGGSMFALVEAKTPERAVEIARAHREKKSVFGGKPSKSVREDRYEPALANDRDVAWARSFGVGVLTDMPEKPQKGAVRSRKRLGGAPGGVAATGHAGEQFCEAAWGPRSVLPRPMDESPATLSPTDAPPRSGS